MIKLTPFQWSSFNFFGFYCAYGVLIPFLPVWLNYYGYSAEWIGMLISLGYLLRFIGAMFISQRIKHPNQLLTVNRLLTWISVLTLIGIAWSVQNPWLLLPAIMFYYVLNGGSMPIGDTIASTWQQQMGIDYGKTRLFGSLAFIIGSMTTGFFLDFLGEQAIIWILTAWMIFLGIGVSLQPTQGFNQSQTPSQKSEVSYIFLLKQPNTLKVILVVALIQASHAAYYAYSTLYWSREGIDMPVISLLWGFAVTCEVLFFFFSNRLFGKWSLRNLLLLSAIGTILRWILLAYTTSVPVLFFMQALHAVSFGVGHYAMIRYISLQPAEHNAKLQALYFSLASCIFMALFTYIASLLYDQSATISFISMVLFVIPAIFLIPKQFPCTLRQSN